MEVIKTEIPAVLCIKPQVYADARGFFMESFNLKRWHEQTGLKNDFVQDNHSLSARGVLRGLHYQIHHPQGKLVRCIRGEIYDVAVDMRRSSPTFGHWVGEFLSADNKLQFWIPEGFAHGFMVLSESAEVLYKTTDYYAPEQERSLLWNDPLINIHWPEDIIPKLSEKDKKAPVFDEAQTFP